MITMAQLLAVTLSHTGNTRRKNEDCFLNGGYVPDHFMLETAGHRGMDHRWTTTTRQTTCLAVFDGIGDSNPVETASWMAAEALKSEISRLALLPLPYVDALMQRYVIHINERIGQEAQNDRALAGMGTTFACLCLRGNQAVVYNLGNCRAFYYRHMQLKPLTDDHLADATHIASRSLQYLGMPAPDRTLTCETTGIFTLQDQDCFLLCSTSLTHSIDESTIRSCLTLADPQQAAAQLITNALEHGGQNSITVTVARWTETEQPYQNPVADTAKLSHTHPANPRIEHQQQVFDIPVVKPKISPESYKISPINFWQNIPFWLQVLSLIGLLGLLLMLTWLLYPNLFG